MSKGIHVPYVNFGAQFLEEKGEIFAAIQNVFERGDFILGKEIGQFEQEFARLCGVKHAIGVANGTDAIIIALKCLGIGLGDEVITASNSWISSASAIAMVGATPVFVDVAYDQNIDSKLIEAAITPRTKAILPIHLTGRCARMPEILRIAKDRKLFVIEDAAQAVMASITGLRAGSMGDISCFSLHPLKNLNAAGDAGIITTSNDEWAKRIRMLGNHGMRNRDEVGFWGYNSRLDTLQAAILLPRLAKLEAVIEKRRKNASHYIKALQGLVDTPIEASDEFHTFHVFVVQCDRRNELQKALSANGIETKIHYPIPIHRQAAANELSNKSLPVTDAQAERILSLPIHQFLSINQIDFVCEKIKKFYLN